jgi:kexin
MIVFFDPCDGSNIPFIYLHRGEDPTGSWTLHIKDQGLPSRNGSFLGWSLSLWGECIDPSKAKLWTFPPGSEEEDATETPSLTISSTKTRPKPTDNLPDGHHTAVGEATKPAFGDVKPPTPTAQTSSSPSATPSVTLDEGYFSHMSDLLSNQTWLFGAIGVVTLFAVIVGVFFWRRRVRRRSADYTAVGTEDHAMGTIRGSMSRLLGKRSRPRDGEGRTKELYDALGEPNDDDDSAGEEDGLVRGHNTASPALRYHDEFLDDDQPDPAPPIRPTGEGERDVDSRRPRREDEGSSSPSGSGTGSWEHASADVLR